MNDIESIIIYGFAGYVIITDAQSLLLAWFSQTPGDRCFFFGESRWLFTLRKLVGVAVGIALIVVYWNGLLGFTWSLVIASILLMPEALWMLFRSARNRSPQ